MASLRELTHEMRCLGGGMREGRVRPLVLWPLGELTRTNCLLHTLREAFGECTLRNVILRWGELLDWPFDGEGLA